MKTTTLRKEAFSFFAVVSLFLNFIIPAKAQPSEQPRVNRYTVKVELAYNTATQKNPQSFLDLDEGRTYSVNQAPEFSNVIDFVYVLRYNAANDPMLISIGAFDGKPGYPISTWNKTTLKINRFQNYNHTAITEASGSFTTAKFQGIKYVADLRATIKKGSQPSSDFKEININRIGNLYVFKTQQGKCGVLRVQDVQDGSNGYAILEIIIEP